MKTLTQKMNSKKVLKALILANKVIIQAKVNFKQM